MISEPIERDEYSSHLKQAIIIKDDIHKKLGPNKNFVDPDFPPNSNSIGLLSQNNNDVPVKWLRPEYIEGDEFSSKSIPWSVTRNPSCEDIVQGKLGNCWFLTGLSSIADRKDLLNKVLITKEINPKGIYQVRLCKDGIWQIVTIDDYFPVNKKNHLIYSRANRKQLWVSIIEKALAKLYGSYEVLTMGFCAVGLSILTGCSCDTFHTIEHTGSSTTEFNQQTHNEMLNTLWAKLLSAKEANLIICAACSGHESNLSSLEEMGLYSMHAYAVLDVVSISELDERLVKLKNPWSSVSWKGKWSNGDSNWSRISSCLQSKFNMYQTSECESFGVFWMSWQDFTKYFTSVDICNSDDTKKYDVRMKSHLPWPVWIKNSDFTNGDLDSNSKPKIITPSSKSHSTTNLEFEHEQNTCAIITVVEPTMVRCVLWQSLDRRSESDQISSDLLIVIFSGYENNPASQISSMKYVASSYRQLNDFVVCETWLNRGTYTVFYFSFRHWCENKLLGTTEYDGTFPPYESPNATVFQCVLSVHSKEPILLQTALLSPEMIPRAMVQFVMNKGKSFRMDSHLKLYSLSNYYSGIIVCTVNEKSSRVQRLTTTSINSTNVVNSRGHPNDCKQTEDVIHPKSAQITTLLTQINISVKYQINLKHNLTKQSNFNLVTGSTISTNHNSVSPQIDELETKLHNPDIKLIVHIPIKI